MFLWNTSYIIFLILFTLKIVNLIDYDWFIIFTPIMLPFLLVLFLSAFISKEDLDKYKEEMKKRKNLK